MSTRHTTKKSFYIQFNLLKISSKKDGRQIWVRRHLSLARLSERYLLELMSIKTGLSPRDGLKLTRPTLCVDSKPEESSSLHTHLFNHSCDTRARNDTVFDLIWLVGQNFHQMTIMSKAHTKRQQIRHHKKKPTDRVTRCF